MSFVERGSRLLRDGGLLGFIVPNKFFRTDYGVGLRSLLSRERAVTRIVDFQASQVFAATTYTCLLFLKRGGVDDFDFATSEASPPRLDAVAFSRKKASDLGPQPWAFSDERHSSLLAKLSIGTVPLLDLPAGMSRGSSTGDDEVFVFEKGQLDIEREVLRVPVFASDFGRYRFSPGDKWRVIFPYFRDGDGFRLVRESELRKDFPKAYTYLQESAAKLRKRKQFREWFGFSAARNLEIHERATIMVPLLADRGLFALIPRETRGKLCPMAGGGFSITLGPDVQLRPEYVLALLNSKLLFWRLRGLSNLFRGGWITCTKQYFGQLPIRSIDLSQQSQRGIHDRIVALVEEMASMDGLSTAARTPHEQEVVRRKLAATDAEIDRLVYDLYGLTDDEIKLVEEEPQA